MTSKRGLLLDLDGVLVDSASAQREAWASWARSHGIDPEEVIALHGMTARDKIRKFLPNLGTVEAEAARMAEIETQLAEAGDPTVPLPGAHAALSSGRPLAVVTSGTHDLAVARLKAAGLEVPPIMITADSVRKGKPAPDPYLLGARRIGLSPDKCDAVEDAPLGVLSAKAAGARVIAVTTTVAGDLLKRADVIVSDLAAALEVPPPEASV